MELLQAGPEQQAEWMRLEQQIRRDLLQVNCEEAIQISTIDDLKRSLLGMVDKFQIRDLLRMLERLNPTLEHVRSFTNAITSASQYSPVACLVWGGIQAVVESACTFSSISDEVVTMIVEVNEDLPQLDAYIALFPGKPEMQWAMQDLFQDLMYFYINAAKYFRRGYYGTQLLVSETGSGLLIQAAANLIHNLFTSSQKTILESTKTRIRENKRKFFNAAKLAHRERVRFQHIEITRRLGDGLTPLTATPQVNSPTRSITFPVTTVNPIKNPLFVGRDDILEGIQATFDRPPRGGSSASQRSGKEGQGPACCVLDGLPGIGKTQIALAYTYKHRKHYDAMFWLESERDWTLASTYAKIAEELGLMGKKTSDDDGEERQGTAIEEARKWLQTTDKKWLLIFDNVEDVNDLAPYLPTESIGTGCIIITTQKPKIFPITKVFDAIHIEPLTREDAANLLFKYLRRAPADEQEKEAARELSDIVDGLPLAIAAMGGYIDQSESALAEFIEVLKYSSNAWTASATGPATHIYPEKLEAVFDIALSELSSKARSLINILAFLNPDSIPEEMFAKSLEKESLDFLRTKADLLEMIRELRGRQLIRRFSVRGERFLSIHRTVQWNVLLHLSKDEKHRWAVFNQAFGLARDFLPELSQLAIPEADKWPKFDKYGPQILSLRTHCLWPDPPVDLPVDFAEVLADVGTYMWQAGKFPEGKSALQTAEDILNNNEVEAHHPLRSNVYEILGIMSSFEGVSEREGSMEMRYKAHKSRHEEYDRIPKNRRTRDDEIRLYIVESDMAYGKVQEELFEEAGGIMERCLVEYKKWGDEDEIPYEYAKYCQIMGFVLMAQGKPVESIQTILHCVDLVTKASNAMHPMTQLMKFCAAILTWHAGEHEKALEISEAVLAARRDAIGEFSHFTLESYSTTARLLAGQGHYIKARQYLERCLERRKRAIWNVEGIARAEFRYSQVLDQLGEHAEAVKNRAAAMKVRERFMKQYAKYLPEDEDEEATFDRMVSLWAGRFTGRLKQRVLTFDTPDLVDFSAGDA